LYAATLTRTASAARLAHNLARIFVGPQRHELRMPQVAVTGPLHERDFGDELRPQPSELRQILDRQPLAPARFPAGRQLGERIGRGLEQLERPPDLRPDMRREPAPQLAGVSQLAVL
jgi:hypothetical protein